MQVAHISNRVMIGKYKTPVCIKNRSWPLIYFNQPRAWMDSHTYKKWFDEVFHPAIQKKTSHPVLLLMDNAPGHVKEFKQNNIFIANCTSWKQRCDLGIIAALKKEIQIFVFKRSFQLLPVECRISRRVKKSKRSKQ